MSEPTRPGGSGAQNYINIMTQNLLVTGAPQSGGGQQATPSLGNSANGNSTMSEATGASTNSNGNSGWGSRPQADIHDSFNRTEEFKIDQAQEDDGEPSQVPDLYAGFPETQVQTTAWDGKEDTPNDSIESILRSQGYEVPQIYEQNDQGQTLIDQVAAANDIDDPNVIQPNQNLVVPTNRPVEEEEKEDQELTEAGALDIVQQNLGILDALPGGDGAKDGPNGVVGAGDIQNVANGNFDEQAVRDQIRSSIPKSKLSEEEIDAMVDERYDDLVGAAQYYQENPEALNSLDRAHDNTGQVDGLIAGQDIDQRREEVEELGHIQNLNQNAAVFDNPGGSKADGKIGFGDIKTVAGSDFNRDEAISKLVSMGLPQDQAAQRIDSLVETANYFKENPELFERLDTTAGQGPGQGTSQPRSDGFITQRGFDEELQNVPA